MRYSSYVALNVGIFLVLTIVFGAIFIEIAGGAGAVAAVFFGLFMLLGLGLSIAWAHRAVTEFHGAPFPGIWGVLGVDIVPDRYDSPPPLVHELPTQGTSSEPNLAQFRAPQAQSDSYFVRGCVKCGTITRGDDSKFCRKCGQPFEPAVIVENWPNRRCATCGAYTLGLGSQFCRVCDTPLGPD